MFDRGEKRQQQQQNTFTIEITTTTNECVPWETHFMISNRFNGIKSFPKSASGSDEMENDDWRCFTNFAHTSTFKFIENGNEKKELKNTQKIWLNKTCLYFVAIFSLFLFSPVLFWQIELELNYKQNKTTTSTVKHKTKTK